MLYSCHSSVLYRYALQTLLNADARSYPAPDSGSAQIIALEMIMAAAGGGRDGRHVTAWSGYDLGYPRKNQGQGGGKPAAKTPGGYYIDAVQGGEPPGSWWGPSAQA